MHAAFFIRAFLLLFTLASATGDMLELACQGPRNLIYLKSTDCLWEIVRNTPLDVLNSNVLQGAATLEQAMTSITTVLTDITSRINNQLKNANNNSLKNNIMIGPAGPAGSQGPAGPTGPTGPPGGTAAAAAAAPGPCSSYTPPAVSSTTTPTQLGGRNVLIAFASCRDTPGAKFVTGSCETFLLASPAATGVEPLSTVAVVPFNAADPADSGYVECRSSAGDKAATDYGVRATAFCCLDAAATAAAGTTAADTAAAAAGTDEAAAAGRGAAGRSAAGVSAGSSSSSRPAAQPGSGFGAPLKPTTDRSAATPAAAAPPRAAAGGSSNALLAAPAVSRSGGPVSQAAGAGAMVVDIKVSMPSGAPTLIRKVVPKTAVPRSLSLVQ